MKTPRNLDDDGALVDAILTDESWTELEASVRQDALASLRTQRRRRRVQSWAAGLVCVVAALGAAVWWRQSSEPQKIALSNPVAPPLPGATVVIRNFTEVELLALFPKGSCVMAEVDGQTRLVVLDEKLAAQGFAVP